MKRMFPSKIHQIESASPRQGQQVIFLVGMHIELPEALCGVVGTDGRAIMKHQIACVRIGDRDVKKPDAGGVSKLGVGNEFKHSAGVRSTGRNSHRDSQYERYENFSDVKLS